YVFGVVREFLCLGQQVQRGYHLRISFGTHAQTFLLAKLSNEHLSPDLRLDPFQAFTDFSFSVRNFLGIEELAEFLQDSIADLETLLNVAAAQVMRGKIEERILLQQRVFKPCGLDGCDFHIWSDATAAEHGASTIRKPDFLVGAALLLIAIVVIIVERDASVIAFDQAAARRVVFGGSESQPGIFRKRINGLDQAFAECGFSGDQATIMVLNGAGNNLRSRSRATIYKDNQRIILATIAVSSAINFFR